MSKGRGFGIRYGQLPRHNVTNKGMQAAPVVADEDPVWADIARRSQAFEDACGLVEVDVLGVLKIVEAGLHSGGDDFPARLGEAFLRIIDREQVPEAA